MLLKHLAWTAVLSAVVSAQTESAPAPESSPAPEPSNGNNLTAVLSGTPELSTLTSVVTQFPELVEALLSASNITILAPSNTAFEQLLASDAGAPIRANDSAAIQALLSYHVLVGAYSASSITEDEPGHVPTLLMENPQFANVSTGQVVQLTREDDQVIAISGLQGRSSVSTANVPFTGGIVHIIDQVLTLPVSISATASANPELSSLVDALTTADVVSFLDGATDLTVFAPNNEALERISSALANVNVEQLTAVLSYHVVNGTVGYSTVLEDGLTLGTVTGEELTIRIMDGNIFVNNALVLSEIIVANGVVHVIDNVLNPANATAAPEPGATAGVPAFGGASSATNGTSTSGSSNGTTTATTTQATTSGTTSPTASGAGQPSSATGAAAPLPTGGMGMAALFGAGAAMILV